MNTELIIIQEYCTKSQIDFDFVEQLENEGLIELTIVDNEKYIHISQLKALERYTRWHYDLAINVEGIDVIRNLLDKIDEMQQEIQQLKQVMRLMD